jgi:hypothetical protein
MALMTPGFTTTHDGGNGTVSVMYKLILRLAV